MAQKKELTVIVADGCPYCKTFVDDIKKRNLNVKIVDATKDSDAMLALKQLGINRVPTIVTSEDLPTGKEFCTLDEGEVKCVLIPKNQPADGSTITNLPSETPPTSRPMPEVVMMPAHPLPPSPLAKPTTVIVPENQQQS